MGIVHVSGILVQEVTQRGMLTGTHRSLALPTREVGGVLGGGGGLAASAANVNVGWLGEGCYY